MAAACGLIAAFKLLKGFALLALGIGALQLLHIHVATIIARWIDIFRVDPHNHFIHLLLAKLSILDDRRGKELSVGTFIYSAIFFTEAIGLALRQRWAEYFTIITRPLPCCRWRPTNSPGTPASGKASPC